MEPSERSLQRLISKTDAQELLAVFADLLPGQQAAVLDGSGRLLAGQGAGALSEGWAAQVWAALQNSPAGGPVGEPVRLDPAVCYPLVADQHTLGWLVLDTPAPAGPALQAALALLLRERLEKRQLARETLDRYREVNLLYHLTERFGASLDATELLRIALSEAQRVIPAHCGIVWLTGGQAAYFGAPQDAQALEGFLSVYFGERPGITTPDILTNLEGGPRNFSSVLYAPLRVQGELLALLALAKGEGQPEFTAGEENLLRALAEQAASAVEKAKLYQQDLQHQRIAEEMAIGQRIQRSLLPKSMPSLPGWEFAASYQAASEVGGDFYDIFPLPGDTGCQNLPRYGLAIADVSGKGIPAALMMAFSQGILHTAAFVRPGPADVLRQTNQSILQSSHSGLLLTAFYAVLNPCTGLLSYANGGHEPPLLYQAVTGQCHELNCGQSLLLGAWGERSYTEFDVRMKPGDILLLYTDGVTEARSTTGAFFAEERLTAVLAEHARSSCTDLLAALNQALAQFTAGAEQSDDITMVAIRRVT